MTFEEFKKAGQAQMAFVRFLTGWIGLAIIIMAFANFCGAQIPLPGDWWQQAIVGLALK